MPSLAKMFIAKKLNSVDKEQNFEKNSTVVFKGSHPDSTVHVRSPRHRL